MDGNWAEYWWSRVTGPKTLVDSTVDSLKTASSVALVIPRDLPWRHELRDAVRESLSECLDFDDLAISIIDLADEGAEGVNPGAFLLEKYALREDRRNYREGGRESIQSYLFRKHVMRKRIVWIKGIGPGFSRAWIDFCSNWSSPGAESGLFVVETRERPELAKGSHLAVLDYEKHVSEYDVKLFDSLVAADGSVCSCSDKWKRYASSVAAHLCGADAELAFEFLSEYRPEKDDPIAVLSSLEESGLFERRGEGDHPLALLRDGRMIDISHLLWSAQVEELFPLVEKERLSIVDSLRKQLDREISQGITQFNKIVEAPEDIELGTLVYLIASRRIYVPDSCLSDRVHTLRKCRNNLAHKNICSVDDVALLLCG